MTAGLYTLATLFVYFILYIITAAGLLIVIPLSWIGARKPVNFLLKTWARTVFFLMGKKLSLKGLDNLDKSQKYILVANHSSLFDIVTIISFYPEVSWFGHERLLKIPVFRHFLKLINYVPFKEPTIANTREMLNQLIEKSEVQSVAIFPEGTRTLNGRINPFYRGFIYLLRTREIDVLPVTLNGFYYLKPKNRFFIDFGSKPEVVIHKPIPGTELKSKTDNEIIDQVRNVIESAYIS